MFLLYLERLSYVDFQTISQYPSSDWRQINLGKALEFATQGIARATSHQVVSPPPTSRGPRYSVPFFHNIALDVQLTHPDYALECKLLYSTMLRQACNSQQCKVSDDIKRLRDARGQVGKTDCAYGIQPTSICATELFTAVNFTEFGSETSGMVNLIGRVKYVRHHSI